MTDGWIRALVEAIHSSPTQAVLYLSGGASQSLGWLMSVPGASNTVLEAVVPYSRNSMIQLLSKIPTHFASQQTVEEMALSAYNRALKLSRPGLPVVGVGFTGSLASVHPKYGDHRFYLSTRTSDRLWVSKITLSKGLRTREQEDKVSSHFLVKAIADACKVSASFVSELNDSEMPEESEKLFNEDQELQQLINGEICMKVYPFSSETHTSKLERKIILSGSFNPLHDGHVKLLEVATSVCSDGFPCFEISAINADKPPLTVSEIKDRVKQFEKVGKTIIISNQPYFYKKAELFPEIPFFLFQGEAIETIPNFLRECGASLLVMDFSPLREVQRWKEEICRQVDDSVAVHEVDAHNVVPLWVASKKLEYSARTLRGKIHKLLPEYLIDFPNLQSPNKKWKSEYQVIDWENLIADVLRKGAEVPELEWCESGEVAAMEVLLGSKDGFLSKRLKNYSTDRNNPLKPKGLSGLSPYLHFGQISAQRCALEARNVQKVHSQSADAFLEELIVRRELADNFCFYQPQYDSLQGAWEWARKTLMDHASDKREHLYTKEQLEKAETADPLWNASQLEMVYHGKMHGFMRMYWAKKILEWTSGPEEALSIAIYLNDKYEIDGRDPNGYVGCMWSICGVHDQGWKERPVFGKIRYMNYAGCKRKFDVDGYISYVKGLVSGTHKRKAGSESNSRFKVRNVN